MSERLFVDGPANTPRCHCAKDCEMPCWQLVGLTDEPCGACGCGKGALEVAPIPAVYVPNGMDPDDKAGYGTF